jgi:hypothetical protein
MCHGGVSDYYRLREEINCAVGFMDDFTTIRNGRCIGGCGLFIFLKYCIICRERCGDENFKTMEIEVKDRDPILRWEFLDVYRV